MVSPAVTRARMPNTLRWAQGVEVRVTKATAPPEERIQPLGAGAGKGEQQGIGAKCEAPPDRAAQISLHSSRKATAVMTPRLMAAFTIREGPLMPKPRNIDRAVARARAHVASLTARKADPESIEAARAQLAEANAAADVRKWPPLADRARLELARLVLAGGDDRAAT